MKIIEFTTVFMSVATQVLSIGMINGGKTGFKLKKFHELKNWRGYYGATVTTYEGHRRRTW